MNPIIECRSLDEVRGQIDRLDRQLVELIAERGAYVQQAARFKKDAAAVAAPQRVAQVRVVCFANSRTDKACLRASGSVVHPRHSFGYACGARLAENTNPALSQVRNLQSRPLVRVDALAVELGAERRVVEATWRAMIAAFIDAEQAAHAALHPPPSSPTPLH